MSISKVGGSIIQLYNGEREDLKMNKNNIQNQIDRLDKIINVIELGFKEPIPTKDITAFGIQVIYPDGRYIPDEIILKDLKEKRKLIAKE